MMDNKARTLTGQEKAQQLYVTIREMYGHCQRVEIIATPNEIRIITDTKKAYGMVPERKE